MNSKALAVTASLILAPWPGAAGAQERIPVRDALAQLLAQGYQQCDVFAQRVAAAAGQEKPEVVEGLKSAYRSLCECAPKKIKWLQVSLPPSELTAEVSESEIEQKYLPRIIGRCGVEELRATYSQGCEARIGRTGPSVPHPKEYCKCMSERVSAVSDQDAMLIGTQNADWTPLAAEAEKKGLPRPDPPSPLKQFIEGEKRCRSP